MGIIWDGSEYQANEVDFSKLKGEIDLAILRDQFGYTKKDSQYDYFVAQCIQYGIPFDTYAFFDALDTNDAIAEANSDVQRMAKQSAVAWIDVETMSVKSKLVVDLQAAVNAYYDTLKKAGFQKVGIYSGEYFYNANGLANCKKDCLWLAAYGSNDGTMQAGYRPQVPGVDLWQYTSKGKLSAINGDCDLSLLVGSKSLSFFTGVEVAPPHYASNILGVVTMKENSVVRDAPDVTGNVIQEAPGGMAYLTYSLVNDWYSVGGKGWVYKGEVTFVANPDYVAPPTPPVAQPAPVSAAPTAPAPVVANPAPSQAPPVTATQAVQEPAPSQAPPATPAPTVQEPAPSQAPPVTATQAVEIKVNFLIENLEGAALGDLQSYIMGRGWWMDIKKNEDDSINIEVGIFIKDSNSYKNFKNFLADGHYIYTEKEPA